MRPKKNKETVALGEALVELSRDLGLPPPDTLAALHDTWPRIVGADLARHARPSSLRDGVLVVAVDAPAWATQLRYLAAEVLEKLSDRLGDGVAHDLRVVVGGE